MNTVQIVAPNNVYHVWDNYPYPTFNRKFYLSNDFIATISKVSDDIVANVAPEVDRMYVPHAVDTNIFKKLPQEAIDKFKKDNLKIEDDRLIFFWNNRNARRKQSGSLLWWFSEFLNKVGKDKATLIGEGIDKAIILQDVDTKNTLRTVANNSTPGVYKLMDSSPIDFNDNTAPTNVFISGFSFKRKDGSQTDTPIALLDCLTQSSIRRCKFQGVWQNNDGEDTLGASSAIQFRGIGAVTSEYVTVIECEFSNVSHAVYSDYDTNNIQFKDCYFKNLYRAFTLAKNSTNITGRSAGPQYYTVEHCTFDKIDGEAIKVFATASSKGHRSIANTYLDVGNNSLEQSQPVTPVIDFRVPECDTVGDYFQRSIDVNNLDQNKTGLNSSMVAYLPDVLGVDSVQYSSKSTTLFFNTQELTPKILVKAPCWGSTKLTINYSIRKGSSTLYRVGQIVVNAHPDMTSGPITPSITDNFTYTGPTDTYGQTIGGNIRFIATVLNMTAIQIVDNGGVKTPVLTTKPTLVVRYINPAGPGGNATINYTVTIDSGYQDF